MKLTKKLLLQLNAGSSRIEFCESYKLFGFPLDRLDEIQGDYEGFVVWLKSKTNLEFDQNQNLVRYEDSVGYWVKYEYDQNNNQILKESSSGWWAKYEYDQNNNQILKEVSSGMWTKYEYDQNNNQIRWESSNGYWVKYEYEFYDNGQLKRLNNLVIPYFEQEI
jgi:hypothetical protein